jgi:hypothetical protein
MTAKNEINGNDKFYCEEKSPAPSLARDTGERQRQVARTTRVADNSAVLRFGAGE